MARRRSRKEELPAEYADISARLRQLFAPVDEMVEGWRRTWAPVTEALAKFKEHIEQNRGWSKFQAGLHSPDHEQRKRFRAAGDAIANFSLDEAQPILEALERPQRKRGRKPGQELDDADIIKLMVPLVGMGMSVPEAARKYVNRAAQGRVRGSSNSSVVKRLTRKFHRRSKRRVVGE
jgi:hypothetical protein